MKRIISSIGVCVFSCVFSMSLYALDGIRIAGGSGDHSSDGYEIAVLDDFDKTWFDGRIRGQWQLSLSDWDFDDGPNDDLQVFSVGPVFIYDFKQRSNGLQPYIDYGLGLAYVSETKIDGDDLGIHFQFDNRIGFGVRFGSDQRHDLSVSYRHISNAGLDSDNDGYDAVMGAYTYRY